MKNSKLLNQIPKKYLCPYCGEWHKCPPFTLPLRFYSKDRPLKLTCPHYPELFDVEMREFTRYERWWVVSADSAKKESTFNGTVTKKEYVKSLLQGSIGETYEHYHLASLAYFYENGSLHFSTDRKCEDTKKHVKTRIVEPVINIDCDIPLCYMKNTDNKIVTFSVCNSINRSNPYLCRTCEYRQYCLFYQKGFAAEVNLGFEFF